MKARLARVRAFVAARRRTFKTLGYALLVAAGLSPAWAPLVSDAGVDLFVGDAPAAPIVAEPAQ